MRRHFSRRDPGAHIELEFVMERVTGQRIGPRNDRDAQRRKAP